MASYAISFRLGASSDYDKRYQSVMAAIKNSTIRFTWEETTSFVLISFEGTPAELVTKIYLESMLNHITDTLVVINLHTRQYATKGEIKYDALLDYFFR